jgi:hypothetical protein
MIGSTGEPAPAPDGMGIVAGVKDAANRLQLYLDCAAKTGGRPNFQNLRYPTCSLVSLT